ncbi:MAG: tetratricopeptide repeat protein [Geminocystis sp.]|nr:tetratricopeptide repeat protein [Geminocystis sp.]MCS7146792.1 tetratricopeptide repeat protein [Geminocystis sp.]MCX8077058.1 tetratricopeptide repeat protein [Geminocystis sp.]MDW8115618.1 tetratricopeptide repeat protein [Geminocystis sp.]MDW8463160.1 tetratricopeptide repeat protein [Geminocystis sp.]
MPLLAQNRQSKNPLTSEFKSELIPIIERPLTPLEQRRIRERIELLEKQAEEALMAGNDDLAFSLWYEAINLSGYLGVESELKLIARVGERAWAKNRIQDVKFITERLTIIERNNDIDNLDFLNLLKNAYVSIHDLDKLVELNLKTLDMARSKNDSSLEKLSLENLGELYLAKFDYYRAEPIYERLLQIARQEGDYLQEGIYLRKLAEISQALVNPENSVLYKEELFKKAIENPSFSKNISYLPMLKISLGDDYKQLNQPQLAGESYQEAFKMAWEKQLYSIAADALRKLGQLYHQYQRPDVALEIYQELVKVEQLSYNLYGLMNAYDYIATIYLQKQQVNRAREYWQKALEVARNLRYQEEYFLEKINSLKSK